MSENIQSSSSEKDSVRQLNTRIDLLEKRIKEESSPEKLRSILDEVNSLVGDNAEIYSIYKATRLVQQSNFCSNLSLERQSILVDLISKSQNDTVINNLKTNHQDNDSNLTPVKKRFYENWSYADIIRTISLAVSALGVIINLVFNLIQIYRNKPNKS